MLQIFEALSKGKPFDSFTLPIISSQGFRAMSSTFEKFNEKFTNFTLGQPPHSPK